MNRKSIFSVSALLLLILLLGDVLSLTRIISRSMEDIETKTTRGRLQVVKLKPPRGSLISIQENGASMDFSCAPAGLRQFSGCFLFEDWMTDQKVSVKWFEVPANVFRGSEKYPLELDFLELNKKIVLGFSPEGKLTEMIFSKVRDIALSAALYLGLLAIVLKLINLNRETKK